jgi:hypothetical protein
VRGPWLVVGPVLVASAERAAEAIDLSHIPAPAVAAIVLYPERLAKPTHPHLATNSRARDSLAHLPVLIIPFFLSSLD